MKQTHTFIQANKERFLNEIIDLLKIPSISADKAYSKDTITLQQIGRKLTKINVFEKLDQSNVLNRSISLQFTENQSERLKLNKVTTLLSDVEDQSEEYTFEYNVGGNFIYLPEYNTNKIDHWCYFNNVEPVLPTCNSFSTCSDIFNSETVQNTYFNSRNPSSNSNVYLAETLSKIVYPTKGYTVFEFEPNDFSMNVYRQPKLVNGLVTGIMSITERQLSSNIKCGGLRIKQITNYDSDDKLVGNKKYFYVKNFLWNDTEATIQSKLSSGIVSAAIVKERDLQCIQNYENCLVQKEECELECFRLHHLDPDGYESCVSYCPQGCINDCPIYLNPYFKNIALYVNSSVILGYYKEFVNTPLISLYNLDGLPLIYNEVVEKNENGSYDKYIYNAGTTTDLLPLVSRGNDYYFDLISRTSEIHKLSNLTSYSNTGQKVKESIYSYRSDPDRYNNGIRFKSFTVRTFTTAYYGTGFLAPQGYTITNAIAGYYFYYNYFLSKIEEIIYTPQGGINKITDFEYDTDISDKLVIKKLISNSDLSKSISSYTYPKHLVKKSQIILPSNNIYKIINESNIQYPIEAVSSILKNGTSSIINAKLLCYSTLSNNIYMPESVWELETQNPIGSQSFNYCNIDGTGKIAYDAKYKKKMKISYDTFKNDVEYTVFENQNIAQVWGYDNKLLISQTKNATALECGYTGFENNESNSFPIPGYTTYEYVSDSYTGKKALKVKSVYGPTAHFAVATLAQNHSGYKASVWVKGPTNACLHIQVDGQYSTNMHVTNTGGDATTWHLLEAEVPWVKIQPYLSSNLNIGVFIGMDGGGEAIFDDLRFYPMDAQMTSYSYDPLIGVTSVSDVNNKPVKYEYDGFGRLVLVSDFIGNILKKYNYYYRP